MAIKEKRCIHRHTAETHPGCFGSGETKCAFYFADSQIPFHDERLLKFIFQFAREVLCPDVLINGGDFIDLKSFGKYESKNQIEGFLDSLDENYEIANRITDRFCEINPDAEKHLLEGNHDYRIYKFGQKQANLLRTISVERNLRLKERGIEFWLWCKPREGTNKLREGKLPPLKLGKLDVYHGLRHNQYHAQYNIAEHSHSMLYAHVHDFQMASGRRHDRGDRHLAYAIGHTCDESQMEWRHGKASNWIQGFAVIYWQPKTGYFTVYPVPVTNYQFCWMDGKIYRG